MQIEVKRVDGVGIVSPRGRLVAGVGDVLLRDAVNGLLGEGCKDILLDLSEVRHIDSSGIGELVASRRIVQRFGGRLKVVRAEEGVEAVFHIARILPLFSFYDDLESAFAAFGSDGDLVDGSADSAELAPAP